MNPELQIEIVYENNLDTNKFARMFNNKAQSYKFYWFEAILNVFRQVFFQKIGKKNSLLWEWDIP